LFSITAVSSSLHNGWRFSDSRVRIDLKLNRHFRVPASNQNITLSTELIAHEETTEMKTNKKTWSTYLMKIAHPTVLIRLT